MSSKAKGDPERWIQEHHHEDFAFMREDIAEWFNMMMGLSLQPGQLLEVCLQSSRDAALMSVVSFNWSGTAAVRAAGRAGGFQPDRGPG